jgi:hypothetical protein
LVAVVVEGDRADAAVSRPGLVDQQELTGGLAPAREPAQLEGMLGLAGRGRRLEQARRRRDDVAARRRGAADERLALRNRVGVEEQQQIAVRSAAPWLAAGAKPRLVG